MRAHHITSESALRKAQTLRDDQIAMLIDTLIQIHAACNSRMKSYQIVAIATASAQGALTAIGGKSVWLEEK